MFVRIGLLCVLAVVTAISAHDQRQVSNPSEGLSTLTERSPGRSSALGFGDGFRHTDNHLNQFARTAFVTTYENENLEAVFVYGGHVTIQNCTVGSLNLLDSKTDLYILAVSSTIGKVDRTGPLLGNATFIDCKIGDDATAFAFSFQSGTGRDSIVSIVNTSITSGYNAVAFGDTHGAVTFIDSIIRLDSSLPTYGVVFSGYIFGTVKFVRCDVRSSTTSTDGATAVRLHQIRGGVFLDNCSLEAFSQAPSQTGVSTGLFLDDVAGTSCVYVSGGSIMAHCSNTTYGHVFSVVVQSLGGALVLDNAVVKSHGFLASYGLEIATMNSNSVLLVQHATVVASTRSLHYQALTQQAIVIKDTLDNATTVFESTTLRAPQGACLYFSSSSPVPHGLVEIRGLTLAECYRSLVDTSSTSSVTIDQNCVTLPGNHRTDKPIGYPPATTVFPCVNDTPRTTPVRADFVAETSLRSCAAFGSVTPFSVQNATVTLSGLHENETFDRVLANGSSSLTLRNCTVGTLIIHDSTADLDLLVADSTIGQVETTSQFLGNATFVRCAIGDEEVSEGLIFPSGAGKHSALSISASNITAAQHGMYIGNSAGTVEIVDSTIVVHGRTDTYGARFNGHVSGTVAMTRSVVSTSSTSTAGAVAMFIKFARSGIHLVDCDLTAFSDTGGQGSAIGLQVQEVGSHGCVYITGGSVNARCSADTQANVYGVFLQSIRGGAVTFAGNATIASIGTALSFGLYIQYIESNSILLVRSTGITALAHLAYPTLSARSFFVGTLYGNAVAVFDAATLRSPQGACLYFSSFSKTRSGLVDLRGLRLPECHRNVFDTTPESSVSFHQNCVTIDGNSTDAPVAYPPATTVDPCVNNTPRTTPIETSATTAGSCSALGPITPFRIPMTTVLRGNVTRSNQYLGILTVEDPELVSLTNIGAVSISFTKSSITVSSHPRVTISASAIGSGGVQFAAMAFSNIDLIIEGTTISSPTPDPDGSSTLPLLNLYAVEQGSVTVRDSTITGRQMVYGPATMSNSTIVFQNTRFITQRCPQCAPDVHVDFAGELLDTNVSFIGCSIQGDSLTSPVARMRSQTQETNSRSLSRKTRGKSTKKNSDQLAIVHFERLKMKEKTTRTALRFGSLVRARVTISGMTALMQHTSPSRFLDVGYIGDGCITISNSTVAQSCSQDASSSSACVQAEPSYFFHSGKAPTGSSYLTLDNVSITVATYSATAVYMPYLQNIDVVMSKVNAVLNPRVVSSYLFYGADAELAVVALLQSTVSVSTGYIYRLGAVDHDVSLLTVHCSLSATSVMHDQVSRSSLNARQGCNNVAVTRADPTDADFGTTTDDCIETGPSMCAMTPAVYHALGITANKTKLKPSNGPSPATINVWIIAGVLGAWGVAGCAALTAFALLRCRTFRPNVAEVNLNSASDSVISSLALSTDDEYSAVSFDAQHSLPFGLSVIHDDDEEELSDRNPNTHKSQLLNAHHLNEHVHAWLRDVDGHSPLSPPEVVPPALPRHDDGSHDSDRSRDATDVEEEEVREDLQCAAMAVEE